MDPFKLIILSTLVYILCFENIGKLVEGRAHYHKKKGSGSSQTQPSSPAPADNDQTPPYSPVPGTRPVVPSDPYPYPYPDPSPAQGGPCIFDVTSFGAVGDGSTDDTAAFRSAWKAACAAGWSVVHVPSSGKFMITSTIFSGPCKPGIVLQVDGILMPPDGPECWPETDSKRQWVQKDQHCLDHAIAQLFFMSKNIELSGLRIQNSPQFHIKFDGCDGVLINKLQINSPKYSPNTDGIHVENSKNVAIYNALIANGDDCISIGPGSSNVDIQGVVCDHSHGISIGSLGVHNSEACVSNITVRGALIKNSDNGLRIKTWQGGSGSVSDISFQDIQMENNTNSIIIDQYYCLTKACRNQTSAVYLSGVTYRNIKGTYNNVQSAPIHFACSDTVPCTNITMSEVELLPSQGQLVDDPFCWNSYGIQETLTIPPIDCLQDGMPESLQEVVACCQ
ncbi:hypothetical protein KSS87_012465 [Heliosperma pusillum]|nr:hypothetical protein KSS87_012465 [Heliosperma pusillum]